LTFSHFLDFYYSSFKENKEDESNKELEFLTRISTRLKVFNKHSKLLLPRNAMNKNKQQMQQN